MRFDWTQLTDGLRTLCAIPRVELARRIEGPGPLVERLRAEGKGRGSRSEARRAQLRRTIAALDALLPGGGNCYRRALVEIALDPDSAAEPLFMGLVSSGRPKSGHAWLGSGDQPSRSYDAIVVL